MSRARCVNRRNNPTTPISQNITINVNNTLICRNDEFQRVMENKDADQVNQASIEAEFETKSRRLANKSGRQAASSPLTTELFSEELAARDGDACCVPGVIFSAAESAPRRTAFAPDAGSRSTDFLSLTVMH